MRSLNEYTVAVLETIHPTQCNNINFEMNGHISRELWKLDVPI